MNAIIPRFEFRTFAQDLVRVQECLAALSHGETVRENREVYLLRPKEWHRNIKIRGGRLELKELIEQRQGLQRWTPAGQWAFPIGSDAIQASIFPGWRFARQQPGPENFSKSLLLEELVGDGSGLLRANVFKRRMIHSIDGGSAELDDILVNGALIRSVAVESEDADTVVAARQALGLAGHENISYPLAIARIMGREPLPDEDSYG